MKINNILIAALLVASLCGCKNAQKETPAEPTDSVAQTEAVDSAEAAEPEIAVEAEPEPATAAPTESYFDRKAKQGGGAKPAAATQAAKSQRNTQAETIYVETDGAQGRVWGHVTMKGDRGTGTIHDWDENTLTVTVTRHGDELFAVDQNSRQYVFKLKQNKTQE